MARDVMVTLVGLRRFEERRALSELAGRRANADTARRALGERPAATGPEGETTFAALEDHRFVSRMCWASWGARLQAVEEAEAAEVASVGVWKSAAADLRSVERLVERRAAQRKLTAARHDQRGLDETAVNMWRRAQGGRR